MKKMIFKLFLVVFYASFSLSAWAGDSRLNHLDNNGKEVSGHIKSAGQAPLKDVTVTIYTEDNQEIVLHTDKKGSFSIGDLKPGTYKMVFTKNGYQKITRQRVVIKENEGFMVKLQMQENDPLHIFPSPLHFGEF